MENILGFWKEFGPQIFYGIPLGQYNQLIAVDYKPYFELAKKENISDAQIFASKLYELEILREDDSDFEKEFFTKMFHDMLSLFSLPLQDETFDFSNGEFLVTTRHPAEEVSQLSGNSIWA